VERKGGSMEAEVRVVTLGESSVDIRHYRE
jgi:hypothetical protein